MRKFYAIVTPHTGIWDQLAVHMAKKLFPKSPVRLSLSDRSLTVHNSKIAVVNPELGARQLRGRRLDGVWLYGNVPDDFLKECVAPAAADALHDGTFIWKESHDFRQES